MRIARYTDASIFVPLVVLHPLQQDGKLVQLGNGGDQLEYFVQLIADVDRPVRIRPRRRQDQHRVGEHDRAHVVRLVCRAYDGILGGMSFDGESVWDEKRWRRARRVCLLTLAGMS